MAIKRLSQLRRPNSGLINSENVNEENELNTNNINSESNLVLGKKDSEEQVSSYIDPLMLNGNQLMESEAKNNKWIIEKLLPIGLTVFVANPKTGKSRFSRLATVEIIFGNPFLNTFKTDKGKVIYITYEESTDNIRDQLEKLLENKGIEDGLCKRTLNDIYFMHGSKLKNNDLSLEEFIQSRKDKINNLKLVVIDPWGAVTHPDNFEKNPFKKDYQTIHKFQQLALELQIGILIIHHTKKVISENIFQMVSGTQGIAAPADAIWVLGKQKGSNNLTLNVQAREREEGFYYLKSDKDFLDWEYEGDKIPIETTPERGEILEIFKRYPNEKLKTGFIAQQLGKSQPLVSTLIKGLVKQGILVSGGKFGFYKISDDYINKI